MFKDVHESIIPPYLWEMVHGLCRLKKTKGLKFSTGNIFDGIAACKSCGVLLKSKDQSPAGAKGRYVKYQCPACGKKVNAQDLHKVVLARVAVDWSGSQQMTAFEKQSKALLRKWRKLLDAEKKGLSDSKERATMGLHTENLPSAVERSFQVALSHINERLREIQALEQRISVLQDDPFFHTSLERFGDGVFDCLSDVEKRAFLMAVVESVKVSFGSSHRVSLEYRLSPFVGLGEEIGQITETTDESLGKKPKAQ